MMPSFAETKEIWENEFGFFALHPSASVKKAKKRKRTT